MPGGGVREDEKGMARAFRRRDGGKPAAVVQVGIWEGAEEDGDPEPAPAGSERSGLTARAVYDAQLEDRGGDGPLPGDHGCGVGQAHGQVELWGCSPIPPGRRRGDPRGG